MSAPIRGNVISLDHELSKRDPLRLCIGDRVRRRSQFASGTLIAIVGSGAPADPLRGLVQFTLYREMIPVAFLEAAPGPGAAA